MDAVTFQCLFEPKGLREPQNLREKWGGGGGEMGYPNLGPKSGDLGVGTGQKNGSLGKAGRIWGKMSPKWGLERPDFAPDEVY